MSPDREISSKELDACAKAASRQAVRNAQTNEVAYTVQEGRNIVQHRPDGTKVVVNRLDKAFVRPSTRRFKVS